MKILLLGSGGREHAFAYKISQSPLCSKLFIAPGNPGTEKHGTNTPIAVTDFEGIGNFVQQNHIDMIVVGPEDPLVAGIDDFFESSTVFRAVSIIGPSKAGAQLEGSKDYAKAFMKKYSIPTADYEAFSMENIADALSFIEKQNIPMVLKADGLASGKGVRICESIDEAKTELNQMLGGKFGSAGKKVVIEEFLKGAEMSVFILSDSIHYKILPTAKDYKRIGEGDTGLNTGGMGAISPVPFADELLMEKIEKKIIKPTIDGLQQEKIIYKGFLYFGLMIVSGEPFLIEYNCRMGDPETEVVLPRLKTDLVELLLAVANQNLAEKSVEILPYTAATVVLASGGYPLEYEKGKLIDGLQNVSECLVFHAGTRNRSNGDLETNGGRVITITAFGRKLKDAVKIAARNAEIIKFEGKYFRKDIGADVTFESSY
ncbi:MAG: phosphoribosylamine--glycine ligase [Chitinophagales bacterium]|nr:phosphoribosylamine--glycine ligase [Chitinophagales bacterium]